MVLMSNIFYFFKEAFINFKRNWSTSLGAIITIFLSLFVIGLFMVATIVINNVLGEYEEQVSISVFIADTAEQADIDTLTNYIEGLDDVSATTWVSKEQALEDFANSGATNPEIIEQLDGTNPLPASIKVELEDSQQVEAVANQILSNTTFTKICDNPDDPTDSVKYGQQTVQKLFQIINYIRYASAIVVALLVFVTFIFINNTIRLAIMARRREISIMRLVGASNAFIRGPFLMEGALQAILGAGLAIGLLAAVKQIMLPKIQSSIAWLDFTISSSAYMQINILLIAIGLLIGLFGSALAMRRYLKV